MSDRTPEQIALDVGKVFTPAVPVSDRDLFIGRIEEIRRLVDAINQRGQHAAIFGNRGVGGFKFLRRGTRARHLFVADIRQFVVRHRAGRQRHKERGDEAKKLLDFGFRSLHLDDCGELQLREALISGKALVKLPEPDIAHRDLARLAFDFEANESRLVID